MELVRAGNDRAFEAIVLRYRWPLLRHCRRLLPAARAEDAVQTAFLHALEAIRADQRELQLGAWLHRIARNTAIDTLRRSDSHWEELDEGIDGVEPIYAAAERRARFRSVVADLGALPERQRRALVLRELEGRSYDEIATTLEVSGAGVRQLLNRARNAMRVGAGALVPAGLLGRLAKGEAGASVSDLVDSPGSSTLLAKATAVAAGAVALLTVTAPGDRVRAPHPWAEDRPRAVERAADAGGSGDHARVAQAGAGRRQAVLRVRTSRPAGERPGGPAGERPAPLSVAVRSDGDGVDRFDAAELKPSEPRTRSRPRRPGGRAGDQEVVGGIDEVDDPTGGPLDADDDGKPVVDDSPADEVVADAAVARDDDQSAAGADVPENEDAVLGDHVDPVTSGAGQVPVSPAGDDDEGLE